MLALVLGPGLFRVVAITDMLMSLSLRSLLLLSPYCPSLSTNGQSVPPPLTRDYSAWKSLCLLNCMEKVLLVFKIFCEFPLSVTPSLTSSHWKLPGLALTLSLRWQCSY